MIRNVCGVDRVIRILAGLSLVALAAAGMLRPWAWLGLIVLATGVVGHCMPYTWLGLNTCKNSANTES
jgi:hypothetical protein